ncbi:MAG: PP2C family protein-serine/threonine phosphatase [Chlorobi bacterium]|nr:PP2C family protein-serine/threonine phosphatase [Chlorobiota bacterium]
MLLNLTTFSSEPIDAQILSQILERIVESDILAGEELPSAGKLSRMQHIGKSAVIKAYRELERIGAALPVKNGKFAVNKLSDEKLSEFADKIKKITKEESEKFNAELEAARQIQKGLLPRVLPENDELSAAAYSTISKEVGGDFYDLYKMEDGKYGILIGDASGKGLPAAMLISQIQAIIKSDVSHRRSINRTLSILNAYLKTFSSAKNFATLFYGILDAAKGEMVYSNAGHNFPLLVKQNGEIKRLRTTGPALGLMRQIEYEEKTISIGKNETLFLFTDGLSETLNNNGEMFGEERIENICLNNKENVPSEILDEVKRELKNFRSARYENDDTTFMAVKRK